MAGPACPGQVDDECYVSFLWAAGRKLPLVLIEDCRSVLPTHGQVSPLSDLVDITGYPYPQFSVEDWRFGAAM